MVIATTTRHGSPHPRRRTRPLTPTEGGRGPLRRIGAGLLALALLAALAAGPALGQAAAPKGTSTVADTESLPIPEGSSTPTSLSDGGGTLLRLGIGLVVVVALIAGVWYVMKRVQNNRYPGLEERGGDLIDIVATTALGPNRALHLVRVGDEIVLLGATDHAISTIVRVGAEDAPGLPPIGPRQPGEGDRARAVATATDTSLVERLRAMTTRHA